eukprot:jgi/Chrzof1/4996/Cz15g07250.t1
MCSLTHLQAFLHNRLTPAFLPSHYVTNDVPLAYHMPPNPPQTIRRLQLTLTPPTTVHPDVDAMFIHRPFQLEREPGLRERVCTGRTVLSSHSRFDEVLTLGYNPALARELGFDMHHLQEIRLMYKGVERVVGMIGYTYDLEASNKQTKLTQAKPEQSGAFDASITPWQHCLTSKAQAVFGGYDDILSFAATNDCSNEETIVMQPFAVLNAMSPSILARLPSECWVVTGQLRKPALEAAQGRAHTVIAVGHERCELWGLKTLARDLHQEFPYLDVIM